MKSEGVSARTIPNIYLYPTGVSDRCHRVLPISFGGIKPGDPIVWIFYHIEGLGERSIRIKLSNYTERLSEWFFGDRGKRFRLDDLELSSLDCVGNLKTPSELVVRIHDVLGTPVAMREARFGRDWEREVELAVGTLWVWCPGRLAELPYPYKAPDEGRGEV